MVRVGVGVGVGVMVLHVKQYTPRPRLSGFRTL